MKVTRVGTFIAWYTYDMALLRAILNTKVLKNTVKGKCHPGDLRQKMGSFPTLPLPARETSLLGQPNQHKNELPLNKSLAAVSRSLQS